MYAVSNLEESDTSYTTLKDALIKLTIYQLVRRINQSFEHENDEKKIAS